MRLFDLHCDTAGECFNGKKSLLRSDFHIDLCKGEYLDEWMQIFAIWIPDELRGEAALDYFKKVHTNFIEQINLNNGKIEMYQRISEVNSNKKHSICKAIVACEGGSPFAFGDGIEVAKSYGVKVVTLTWNAENELGYGCQSGSENGLKPLGKRILKDMAANKIVADVSHLNRKGFYDAIQSEAAVIASHSNSVSVLEKYRKYSEDKFFSCRRSLDDEQIKLLSERGGLIGLNFCKSFLGDEGDDGFEAAYRHLYHMLELGAENTLAIGSDFDGCEINPELCGVDKMPAFEAFLRSKGFGDNLIDKIFFENANKFFKCILQN